MRWPSSSSSLALRRRVERSPPGVARSLELLEPAADHARGRRRTSWASRTASSRPSSTGCAAWPAALARRAPATGSPRSLDQAGNPPAWSVERIMGAKGARPARRRGPRRCCSAGFSLTGLLIAAAAGAAGFFLPDLLLYNAGVKRQEELQQGPGRRPRHAHRLRRGRPGLRRGASSRWRAPSTGPIAGEFARVLSEIQIGKTRGEAFASLGERTTAPEVKTFVSALVQADRLGLPIAACCASRPRRCASSGVSGPRRRPRR